MLINYELLLIRILLNLRSGQAVDIGGSYLLLRVLRLALAWVLTTRITLRLVCVLVRLVSVELVLELVNEVLLVSSLHSSRT